MNRALHQQQRLAQSRAGSLGALGILGLLGLAGILVWCFSVAMGGDTSSIFRPEIGYIALGIFVYCYVVVSLLSPNQYLSAASLYLLLLAVFHLGFAVPFELGYKHSSIDTTMRWYLNGFTEESLFLVCFAIAAYSLGALCVILFKGGNLRKRAAKNGDFTAYVEYRFDRILRLIALVILLLGIAMWFLGLIVAGGVGVFLLPYFDRVILLSNNSIYIFSILFVGLGAPLLASTNASSIKRLGLMVFLLWAVFAFALGYRGEVLFPVIGALICATRSGQRFKLIPLAVGALFILLVSSTVKELRSSSIAEADVAAALGGPIDAIGELGITLRTLNSSIEWHSQGDPLLKGGSYWAPFERTFLRLVPLASRLKATEDDRLFSTAAQNRDLYGIGGSPLAEAYRNFGSYGIFFVLLALGALIAFLDTCKPTPVTNAIVAVVMVPLIIHVRNTFQQVPVQIVIGVFIVMIAVILSRMKTHSR